MARDLRTNYKIGDILSPEDLNRANAQTNSNTSDMAQVKSSIVATAENAEIATQAAASTAEHMSALSDAIAKLPDGSAVSEEVAEHTVQIGALDTATALGEDAYGNAIRPSDIQAVLKTGEFMEVKTDKQGNVLWSIDGQGNLEMNLPMTFNGATHGVEDDRLEGYYNIASKEWVQLVLDAEDNIIFGVKTNGEVIASTMDATLAASTIAAVSEDIKKEYDEAITSLKAEASDPLDKYVSLASGISQDDINNGTSKYHEIAKKSSDTQMSQKACAVLYNLMKLEKENRFLATHWLNIDYRADFHRNSNGYDVTYENDQGQTVTEHYTNYRQQFVTESSGVYSPKLPTDKSYVFDPLTRHAYYKIDSTEYIYPSSGVVSNKTPLLFIYDVRSITDIIEYSADRRAEAKAVMLTLIRKAWVDYKALPVFCWHEPNPYTPRTVKQQAFGYTYNDAGYPQNHRYAIKEILDGTAKLPPEGQDPDAYPSNTYTCCGFDSANHYTYDCPADWFDARCQQVGQFIKDLYEFVGEEIPIIFRLWHECETGSMWWGTPMTNDTEEYKDFYKLTVQKIREYSESHSLLFGFCLEHNFTSPLERKYDAFDARYPGDDYVDIVGFDEYSMGKPNMTEQCISRMKVVSSFAKAHGKPAFIWECGNKSVVSDWYETWITAMQTAGVNFAALMGWGSSYPPNVTSDGTKLNEQLPAYAQYYRRSNMPCAEDGLDLTTITE